MGIILTQYQEPESPIQTQTSNYEDIKNHQSKILLIQEQNIADSFEKEFGSKFQGVADPFYNCHGLTFASKRTGIHEDDEIWKIIKSEYFLVKSLRDVIVGDVILYLSSNEHEVYHSGIVISAEHGIGSQIKIYSKILKGREIVHEFNKGPYATKSVIKFYRITHANRFQQLT